MVVVDYIHSFMKGKEILFIWMFAALCWGAAQTSPGLCNMGHPCWSCEADTCPIKGRRCHRGSGLHFRQKEVGGKKKSLILNTMGFPQEEPFIVLRNYRKGIEEIERLLNLQS